MIRRAPLLLVGLSLVAATRLAAAAPATSRLPRDLVARSRLTSAWLWATDVDGTLTRNKHTGPEFGFNGEEAASALVEALHGAADLLEAQRPNRQIIRAVVTGRNYEQVLEVLAAEGYPARMFDLLIVNVGTEIRLADGNVYEPYGRYLREGGWDSKKVVATGRQIVNRGLKGHPGARLQRQPRANQSEFKESHWLDLPAGQPTIPDGLLRDLVQALARRGIYAEGPQRNVQLITSSDPDVPGRFNLDLLPVRANKAEAIRWLARQNGLGPRGKGLPDEQVLFTGDAGNDLAALTAGFLGGVVGNATVELREPLQAHHEQLLKSPEGRRLAHYWTGGQRPLVRKRIFFANTRTQRHARGVLAAMYHHGLLRDRRSGKTGRSTVTRERRGPRPHGHRR